MLTLTKQNEVLFYTDSWKSIVHRETCFKAEFKPHPSPGRLTALDINNFFIFDPRQEKECIIQELQGALLWRMCFLTFAIC